MPHVIVCLIVLIFQRFPSFFLFGRSPNFFSLFDHFPPVFFLIWSFSAHFQDRISNNKAADINCTQIPLLTVMVLYASTGIVTPRDGILVPQAYRTSYYDWLR